MNINISQKKLDYLDKKFGNGQAMIQQIVDNFVNREVAADYTKKVEKLTVDDKLTELTKK